MNTVVISNKIFKILMNNVNLEALFTESEESKQFLEEHLDIIDENNWSEVSNRSCLSIDFVRKYKHKLDWVCLSENTIQNDDVLLEFGDLIDWNKY